MLGLEMVLLYLGLAAAGAFGVSKGVELYKHSETLDADRYSACIEATKEARQCRGLED